MFPSWVLEEEVDEPELEVEDEIKERKPKIPRKKKTHVKKQNNKVVIEEEDVLN